MWPFRTKTLVLDAPAKTPARPGGYFSTDLVQQALDGRNLNDVGASLLANAPAMPVAVDGATMDEAEDTAGANRIKGTYRFGANESISDALAMWYANQGFIGHQLCAIIAQNWLVMKVCAMPAKDAIRNWFQIQSADGDDLAPDVVKMYKRYDRQMNLAYNLRQFVTFGRVFGIRIMIFEVKSDDATYYEKPFNIDGVTAGSYKGMVQVDPYWTSPLLDTDAVSQADSMHFYEPTWWQINGRKYHRSHLVIFRTDQVADILKPTYLYGGVSIPQKIMERVYAAERTANEGPQLAMTKRLTVFYTNVAAVFAKGSKFGEKMLEWIGYRDNFGIKVADKTDDEIDQKDTSLSDLDSVIMTQYQLVAAQGEVPATKVLGTSPKGFGASGEYENASYHEFLETIQTHDMTRVVERHQLLVGRSFVRPALGVDIETTPAWNPLDTPTAVDLATINKTKADTGAVLIASGSIDGQVELDRIRLDPDSGYTGIEVTAAPDVPLALPGDALEQGQ